MNTPAQAELGRSTPKTYKMVRVGQPPVVSSYPSDFNPPSVTLTSSTGGALTGGANEQTASGPAYTLSAGYAGNGDVLGANDSVNGNWTYTYDPMNRLVTSGCASNATA